ncbi:ABC-type protease/lipase transport system, ATPase and permease components [Serratia rubidaea]|nr:ABC-type protease/lipase transport system, ATPase and permease components [Serratia rubidaea]
MASLPSQQQVASIYYAITGNNSPTNTAFNYHSNLLENGEKTTANLAADFLNSAQGQHLYAGKSSEQIISQVFSHVYGTSPSSAQVTALLNGNSTAQAISTLVNNLLNYDGFDSTTLARQATFENNVDNLIYHNADQLPGLDYQEQAMSIALATMDRGLFSQSLEAWSQTLAAGGSQAGLIAAKLSSPELQRTIGNLDGAELVKQIYTTVHGTAPSAEQIAAYSAQPNKQSIIEAIINNLRDSTSTNANTATQQHAFEARIGENLLYKTTATLGVAEKGGNATGTINTQAHHQLSNAETAVLKHALLNADKAGSVNLKFADSLNNLTINGNAAATVNLSDNGANSGVNIGVNNGNIKLNASSGNDIVNVSSSANIANGTGTFNLGNGNDSLLWAGNATTGGNSVSSQISANGGSGTDTISANFITKSVATTSNILGIRSSTITSNADKFSNFEKIDLAGYVGKSSGTLNGQAVATGSHTFDFGLLNGTATVEGTSGGSVTQGAKATNLGSQGFELSGKADNVKVINAAGGDAAALTVTGNAGASSNLEIGFRQNATNKFDISFNATSNKDVDAGSLSLSSSSSALGGTSLSTVNIASGGKGDFSNILDLVGTNSQVQTLKVTGDHNLDLTLGSGYSNVRTIDASGNTGGINLDSAHGGTGDGILVQLLNILPLSSVTTTLLTPLLNTLGLNGYQMKVTGTDADDSFSLAANTTVTGGSGSNTYELKGSTTKAGITITDFNSAKDSIVDTASGVHLSGAAGSSVADYGVRSSDIMDGLLGSLVGGLTNGVVGLLGGILGLGNSNSLTSKVGIASVAFDGGKDASYVIIDNNDNGTLDNSDSVIYLTNQNHQSLVNSLHYTDVSVNGVAGTASADLGVA